MIRVARNQSRASRVRSVADITFGATVRRELPYERSRSSLGPPVYRANFGTDCYYRFIRNDQHSEEEFLAWSPRRSFQALPDVSRAGTLWKVLCRQLGTPAIAHHRFREWVRAGGSLGRDMARRLGFLRSRSDTNELGIGGAVWTNVTGQTGGSMSSPRGVTLFSTTSEVDPSTPTAQASDVPTLTAIPRRQGVTR